MRVKQLKITSFRGIRDLTLTFDEQNLTVFIGINGVGKSSILDCIAILLSWLLAWIQYDPDAKYVSTFTTEKRNFSEGRYFEPSDFKNESQKTRIEVQFSIEQEKDEINWFLEEGKKPRNTGSVRRSFRRDRTTDQNEVSEQDQLEAIALRIRNQWKEDPKANIPLAVYYPVNRGVLDIPLDIEDGYKFRQVEAYEQALTGVQVSFDSFFKWFRALEETENEERRDNIEYRDRQLEAVRQAIYSILGEEFDDLRVRRKPYLRMTILKHGEEIIVDRLSDGEKSLLAMAGDLARRLAISQPSRALPLEGSAVVLIDEIEQHLHPSWQRRILQLLTQTFPKCQFIVTTHSPQIVSQVQPESIYILEKMDDDIIAKHPESSFGRDSNRILEDLMGVPERPLEIKEKLLELFRVINDGDLEKAKAMQQEIAAEIGDDEPELVKASVSIRPDSRI
ncbi:AAA family ATPase [Capilliphycus salinus ALCB114379]|uniref:AAA family ATPase n=1 Tax=Capilliphycus salinus TaxID=2768948 RepID=UPI0039A72D40